MRSFLVFCAIACAIGTASSAATLTASPVSTGQDIGLFTIEFTDGNANGLLDYDEITSFPPVNTGTIFAGSQDAVRILQIPTIDGISVSGGFLGEALDGIWVFEVENGNTTVQNKSDWTYSLSGIESTPVPVPASVLFLLGGVFGLAGLRRLKQT